MPLTPCSKNIIFIPPTCAPAAGGIARIGIADATLFDFTQAAPVSGVIQPYTAITDLGTSTEIYGVQFTRNKARYTVDKKNDNGTNPAYTHKINFDVPNISMITTQWSSLIDQQGYCCGVLVFLFFNTGVVMIMGESSVNGATLTVPFYTWNSDGKGDSGQKFDEPNAYNTSIMGEYNRGLIQYTGDVDALLAMFAS